MAIVILNSFSHNHAPYEEWLQDLAREMYLFTDEGIARGFPPSRYAEVTTFPDYKSNGNVELAVQDLASRTSISAIIALSENDIIRAAELREALGIPGQVVNSAQAFRDKTYMKHLLSNAGVRVPQYAPTMSALDLIRQVDRLGFPCIAKPRLGVGAFDTHVIRDRSDLIHILGDGARNWALYEVERFISGQMYHVDGLVIDHNQLFLWPSRYVNDCLAYQDNKFCGSLLLDSNNPMVPRLVDFVRSVLDALPTPQTTTIHAEVFHTPADHLVLCEVASRTGGARINDTIYQVFGVNLNRELTRALCGLPSGISRAPRAALNGGWVLVPPRSGTAVSGPASCDLPFVTTFRNYLQYGKRYEGAMRASDSIAQFVVRGQNEAEVQDNIQTAFTWFENRTVWSA